MEGKKEEQRNYCNFKQTGCKLRSIKLKLFLNISSKIIAIVKKNQFHSLVILLFIQTKTPISGLNSWKQAEVLRTKKRNIPGKMMVLLLKKRKRIYFTNKIHKRPAIVVNVSFHLGFFFSQLQPLYTPPSFQIFSFFFPFLLPSFFFCLEVAFYRRILILL